MSKLKIAVIGAGSVVTKDIPAGWAAYGVPARPQRSLVHLPSDPVVGHFETLQEALQDGGMMDAFTREQLTRVRSVSMPLTSKEPVQQHSATAVVWLQPPRLMLAFVFSVALSIFLLGLLMGSRSMVSPPGSGRFLDTI